VECMRWSFNRKRGTFIFIFLWFCKNKCRIFKLSKLVDCRHLKRRLGPTAICLQMRLICDHHFKWRLMHKPCGNGVWATVG
jgi:hypothetical protein